MKINSYLWNRSGRPDPMIDWLVTQLREKRSDCQQSVRPLRSRQLWGIATLAALLLLFVGLNRGNVEPNSAASPKPSPSKVLAQPLDEPTVEAPSAGQEALTTIHESLQRMRERTLQSEAVSH